MTLHFPYLETQLLTFMHIPLVVSLDISHEFDLYSQPIPRWGKRGLGAASGVLSVPPFKVLSILQKNSKNRSEAEERWTDEHFVFFVV